jgi:hypothetical protein
VDDTLCLYKNLNKVCQLEEESHSILLTITSIPSFLMTDCCFCVLTKQDASTLDHGI